MTVAALIAAAKAMMIHSQLSLLHNPVFEQFHACF
jgi:hypothetical protein